MQYTQYIISKCMYRFVVFQMEPYLTLKINAVSWQQWLREEKKLYGLLQLYFLFECSLMRDVRTVEYNITNFFLCGKK